MTSFTCRYASIDDAQRLFAFARRTFTAAFAADNTPEDMQAYLDTSMTNEMQRSAIEDPKTRVLLMQQQEALVAYASVRDRTVPECVTAPQPIELHRFYVDSQWHGTGAASALMEQVYAAARELGGHRLWLGVWEHNPRAIRFYQKQGFTDVGSIGFTLGTSPQTDRVMCRALPSPKIAR